MRHMGFFLLYLFWIIQYLKRSFKLMRHMGFFLLYLLGGILVSLRLSVRPPVCLSHLSCPLCNIYSSGWIISILATNDHYHERVCRTQCPLTLTYIFKVIRPWLRKSCPLCSIYISRWILFIFDTMITIIRVCDVCLANFWNFSALTLKTKSTVLDGFLPYLSQMITSMRGCLAFNDLWPWPISSRLFGLDLENHVLSVAFTDLDGFFPYFVQMITSMRRCVACDDLWPWPMSSRSFDLDFENCVRSVTFSVLNWLFPYLPRIITAIRECVAC